MSRARLLLIISYLMGLGIGSEGGGDMVLEGLSLLSEEILPECMKSKSKNKVDIPIRSGCKFGTRSIDNVKYQIRESSVFDSIAEIFCFMCQKYLVA